ncbi:MAG: hydrogenase maturation protease [Alphaproteobacteria bacterium]|nr:hydrogenase maturation protease [Alphaproteobacteria bacterium]
MSSTRPAYRVIGIGNPDRGDDGAGRAVAQRLLGALPSHVDVIEHSGEATSLLDCLESASAAWLVDACSSAAPAGTVHRFDVAAAPLPQDAFTLSSHGFGLAEAIELARVLDRLPSRCVVYAVEGSAFETGRSISPPVAAAVREICDLIRREVSPAPEARDARHA